MTVQIPVVNAPNLYVDGLGMTWVSTSAISIASGAARDSSNINDIISKSAISVVTSKVGPGGLDAGTVADNTFYAVYLLGDSTQYSPTSAILSANLTAPLIPLGYDMYRRVGYILTDGTPHVLNFWQAIQSGKSRDMYYDVNITISTNLTADAWATLSLATAVPGAFQTNVFLLANQNSGTTSVQVMIFRPTGSSSTNGIAAVTLGASDAYGWIVPLVTVCGVSAGVAKIDYELEDAQNQSSLFVCGYTDQL